MIRKGIIAILTLATIASAYVWVASYKLPTLGLVHVFDWGDWEQEGTRTVCFARKGLYLCNRTGPKVRTRSVGQNPVGQNPAAISQGRVRWLPRGFAIWWVQHQNRHLYVNFPTWFPCVLFAAYPLSALAKYSAHRRRKEQDLCVDCGYDLTGNVTGVCSECGTEIEQP